MPKGKGKSRTGHGKALSTGASASGRLSGDKEKEILAHRQQMMKLMGPETNPHFDHTRCPRFGRLREALSAVQFANMKVDLDACKSMAVWKRAARKVMELTKDDDATRTPLSIWKLIIESESVRQAPEAECAPDNYAAALIIHNANHVMHVGLAADGGAGAPPHYSAFIVAYASREQAGAAAAVPAGSAGADEAAGITAIDPCVDAGAVIYFELVRTVRRIMAVETFVNAQLAGHLEGLAEALGALESTRKLLSDLEVGARYYRNIEILACPDGHLFCYFTR